MCAVLKLMVGSTFRCSTVTFAELFGVINNLHMHMHMNTFIHITCDSLMCNPGWFNPHTVTPMELGQFSVSVACKLKHSYSFILTLRWGHNAFNSDVRGTGLSYSPVNQICSNCHYPSTPSRGKSWTIALTNKVVGPSVLIGTFVKRTQAIALNEVP